MLEFKEQGEDLFISETAVIYNPQEITLGEHVAIDVGVFMSTKATIGDYVHIAPYSVVMPGVTIGEGSVVGAGSVVTEDTEPWTVYVGSPAKPIKARDKKQALDAAKELGYE